MTYTQSQMLQIWKEHLGLVPGTSTCLIERTDGVDIDAMLSTRMRAWYLNLLDNAPLSQLQPLDIAAMCQCVPEGGDCHAATIEFDDKVRRPISIRLSSWHHAANAIPVTRDVSRAFAAIMHNPYAAPSPDAPMALIINSALLVAPYYPADNIESLLAVYDSAPDEYLLHPSALATIPSSIS